MSEWQGFDQRKVCPNCGGYQTCFWKHKRTAASPQGALVLLALALMAFPLLAIAIVLMLKGAMPSQGRLIGLLFTGLLGLGTFLFNRDMREGLKEYDRTLVDYLRSKPRKSTKRDLLLEEVNQGDAPSTIYRLSCRDCGHTWEMTMDEWKKVEQKEREDLINSPSFLPQGKDDSAEIFEKIEWKPPDPQNGILIVVGVAMLLLVAGLSAIGAIWFLSNPDHPYAPVVSVTVIIIGLLIYSVLAVILKLRVAKLIPVVAIGLIAIVLWFFLK